MEIHCVGCLLGNLVGDEPKDYKEALEERTHYLCDRIHFLTSLWASVAKEFQHSSVFFILKNE